MNVEIRDLIAGGSINVRRTEQTAEVEALAASIESHGILQPLLVEDVGGKYKVIDGNRRLAALGVLIEKNIYSEDREVPVHVLTLGQAAGTEASLAANIMRVPLHPVDQYEAFAELEAGGLTPAEIAERFGQPLNLVRQQMALGSLHPEIRAAWRDGKISTDAARSYCLTTDQARQLSVFKKLVKDNNLKWSGAVRKALGEDATASTAVAIVGPAAYREAGGTATEDLFNAGSYVVSDTALAARMLRDAITAKCKQLVDEDGWSFAYPADEIKDSWKWRTGQDAAPKFTKAENNELTRLRARRTKLSELEDFDDAADAELEQINDRMEELQSAALLRLWGAEKRKGHGCLVSVGDKRLIVTFGCKKPADQKAAGQKQKASDSPAAGPASAEPEAPALSAKMIFNLSERTTAAAAHTLANDPKSAMLLLTAAMMAAAAHEQTPLQISLQGATAAHSLRDEPDEDADISFAAALAQLKKMQPVEALAIMARLTASTLNLTRQPNGYSIDDESEAAIFSLIDADKYTARALEIFEPREFFDGVSTAVIKAALTEMEVDPKQWPAKKAELVAVASDAALKNGWLPERMRVPAIDGVKA